MSTTPSVEDLLYRIELLEMREKLTQKENVDLQHQKDALELNMKQQQEELEKRIKAYDELLEH